MITVVISVALYLTSKGGHTMLYKIQNNVYIKTSKIINYIVIILYSLHTHTRMHVHACTYTLAHTHRQTEGMGGGIGEARKESEFEIIEVLFVVLKF